MNPMTDPDATTAAMKYHRAEVTLDGWLEWNGIDPYDPPDGELLEIIPEQFHEEYLERARLYHEYEERVEQLSEQESGATVLDYHSHKASSQHPNAALGSVLHVLIGSRARSPRMIG
jgi:hypothetical protein